MRDEFGDGVAIVFVSATKTEALDLAAGLMIGADDYVVKPFEPEELIARVRRLLERPGRELGRTAPAGGRTRPDPA